MSFSDSVTNSSSGLFNHDGAYERDGTQLGSNNSERTEKTLMASGVSPFEYCSRKFDHSDSSVDELGALDVNDGQVCLGAVPEHLVSYLFNCGGSVWAGLAHDISFVDVLVN